MSMLTFAKQRKERAAAIAAAQADLVAVEAARYVEPVVEVTVGAEPAPVAEDSAEEKPVKAKRGRRKASDHAELGRGDSDDGDDGSAE